MREANKKSVLAVVLSLMLVVCFLLPAMSVKAANGEVGTNLSFLVNGSDIHTVKGLYVDYDNNLYVSMRDIAKAFQGTDKEFSIKISGQKVYIKTDEQYSGTSNSGVAFTSAQLDKEYHITLRMNDIYVDDELVKYHNLLTTFSDVSDCYMLLTSVAMLFDVDITQDWDGVWLVNTDNHFFLDVNLLENEGFFEGLNTVLVGDATSKDVYFSTNETVPYAIASTTKLMTYYVMKEAESKGEISMDDMVTVTEEAHNLSMRKNDAVFYMPIGATYPLEELVKAMLIQSSNESALAIGAHVAGSGADFVERMNDCAAELGLYSAKFYNTNGLPVYTSATVSSKVQNLMSANDMFKLVTAIMEKYPEIADITSMKECRLDKIGIRVTNTNPLLYNIPQVTGLKTGTTNRAGCNLVLSCKVKGDDGDHNLVVVVLGAESGVNRNYTAEVLMRYAIKEFETRADEREVFYLTEPAENKKEIPSTCTRLLWAVMSTAREQGIIE